MCRRFIRANADEGNVEGARRGWVSHRTAVHVFLLRRTQGRKKGRDLRLQCNSNEVLFSKADWESYSQSH